MGPLNYAAFRRFRGVSRRRPELGEVVARNWGETGVLRVRIVPIAENRAQKAAASRFRLIAAAVK